jgi:drug/metabolite transporter (DMT)-like permease
LQQPLVLPYVNITKNSSFQLSKYTPAIICGILFVSDVAVWNIAIQESSATISLLTNLSPLWWALSVLFLKQNPH